ncbi:MAG: hypothetical protein EHM70_21000, partial [Chloroflexota bacterium]
PGGLDPKSWTTDDYMLAIDHLVALHDRFWNLGIDLSNYTWLGRPLESDLNFYIRAADSGLQNLTGKPANNHFGDDTDFIRALQDLLKHAERVAASLKTLPSTFLHGDYWPGNLFIYPDGSLVAYDWQQAGIGPGILDLVNFIQRSLWWYERLPVSPADLIQRYRDQLQQSSGFTIDDSQWETLWNHALLWNFLTDWIGLLADIPDPVLQTRYHLFRTVWIEPVKHAVSLYV